MSCDDSTLVRDIEVSKEYQKIPSYGISSGDYQFLVILVDKIALLTDRLERIYDPTSGFYFI